jgi:hypothetical protein
MSLSKRRFKKISRKRFGQRFPYYRSLQSAGFLYLAISGWQRLSLAWASSDLLKEVGMALSPWYLVASGLTWMLLGLCAAGLVFVMRRWAFRTVFGLGLFAALSYWLDRLLLTRSDIALANWPFAALATVALLAFNASLLTLLSNQENIIAQSKRPRN